MDNPMMAAGQQANQTIGNLFGFLAPYKNPADAGMNYYNQIPGQLQQYLGPYATAGSNMLPQMLSQYGQLTSNPGGMINQIGQGYHESPGFQFQVQQALRAANSAGAAGGMAGSPEEQQGIAGTVNNLANQDYNTWLDRAMSAYNQGLQGEQGIYNTGAQSANSLAQSIAAALMNQGNMAMMGQNLSNQRNQGMFSDIGQLLL
jgi:hypothetical protein